MMHPRFWEFVGRVRDAGTRVGFTTNAALLGAENRRALLESGVEILGVSLAGASNRTHDRFREGNSLDLIDRHLSLLLEEKDAYGSDSPCVHLAYLLLAANLSELPKLMNLASRWGASQVVVSTLDLVLGASLENEALSCRPELWPELEARLEEARKSAEEAGIVFQGYGFDSHQFGSVCRENVLKSCFISSDGWVSPCVMANLGLEEEAEAHLWCRGEKHPIELLRFGNVHDRSVEEIWWSDSARKFRDTFRKRIWQGRRDRADLPKVCTHCHKLRTVQLFYGGPRGSGLAAPNLPWEWE
jgi:MoaA/NifB/PqqE/SkfB family radical SAM enzyme